MQRTMLRSAAWLVAPVVLLVLVVSIRVAIGRTTAIEEPVVIDLVIGGSTDHSYRLPGAGGDSAGIVTVYREPALDGEGERIGVVFTECFRRTCSSVARLRDTASTDAGTVNLEGLFGGFNGEHLAVTGGTGAYENARGYAELHVVDDGFVRTLHLIP